MGGRSSDEMPKRDIAVVNKLLAELDRGGPPPSAAASPTQHPASVKPRMPTRPVVIAAPPKPPWRPITWLWLMFGALLAAALPQWPYAHECGLALAPYVAGVSMATGLGGWCALMAWRGRRGTVHVLSLAIVAWGLTLAAGEVLPRVGYAKAEASWRCVDTSQPETSPAPLVSPEEPDPTAGDRSQPIDQAESNPAPGNPTPNMR